MYSLSQAVREKGAAGEPLPSPFKGLTRLEAEFRRGELSVVAAAGGTGKSVLAINLAVQSNVPCLYFSADSTAATQLSRATAIITGDDSKVIKRKLHDGDFAEYAPALAQRWWIRFNFEARPTPATLELMLECFREVFGIYPHLVVLDNLSNVDAGAVDSAESYTFGLEGLCDYLAEMARETHAHVMGMHHVVGEYSDGLKPIPQSGLRGKISRVPSLILTMHKEGDGMSGRTLNISVVKNREGREDSSGETYTALEFNQSNIRIRDVEHAF
ncbi:AAA family ATPase [Streptomyces roseoverticillatus]|uniref:AAA family ATPase n=1 Tax=Streptomyces roseoverticillatus TaxID=66429 RepID=UPI001F2ED195|nr:AAA family ATPase [Streptomyces roseoverticillatus]MCF3100947.1 AAA family ATPase [Streptomyces roseoverticillatus]